MYFPIVDINTVRLHSVLNVAHYTSFVKKLVHWYAFWPASQRVASIHFLYKYNGLMNSLPEVRALSYKKLY